jgi:hypothetical protein
MRKKLKPDFIVAMLAVIIGLSTMFVYIYQARIMSRQMHATVWPYIEANFSYSTGQNPSVSIIVTNKGVGPAIVKSAYIILDDQKYSDSQARIDSLALKLTGISGLLDSYTNLTTRVISPGEEIKFIGVTDSLKALTLIKSLSGHRIRTEICYCSVFEDCWKVESAKVTPCDRCE